jgi:hypothetical protein
MAGQKFHVTRDRDSGKMGTATSLNRVGCGKQHLKSPLHALAVVLQSPTKTKKGNGQPPPENAYGGFFVFFWRAVECRGFMKLRRRSSGHPEI